MPSQQRETVCLRTPRTPWTFDFTRILASTGQIIIIDILLGGDNAVVIALACRKLPLRNAPRVSSGARRRHRLAGGADRLHMTRCRCPSSSSSARCCWCGIGVKPLAPDEEGHGDVQGSDKLLAAIKTIIVADLVMSVDNVIAIAGAARTQANTRSCWSCWAC